jgi:hypothetical protein
MALNCPFEHPAYMLYLLFQVIRSFRVVTSSEVMPMVLNSKATKTRSCNFDMKI